MEFNLSCETYCRSASMGLRFFKRRNNTNGIFGCSLDNQLQWGCAFSSAEISNAVALTNFYTELQWGCAFSSAEIGRSWAVYLLLPHASMGLRFFKRRNPIPDGARQLIRQLQWGCAFSSAEIIICVVFRNGLKRLQWGCAFSSAEIGCNQR